MIQTELECYCNCHIEGRIPCGKDNVVCGNCEGNWKIPSEEVIEHTLISFRDVIKNREIWCRYCKKDVREDFFKGKQINIEIEINHDDNIGMVNPTGAFYHESCEGKKP